jgi:DNA-binding transcriptional regulator YdaS (Cro superfamily)
MTMMTEADIALARVLRGLAAKTATSQGALAAACGLSQSQVSKCLRGVRPLTVGQADAIAAELGGSLADLVEESAHVR